MIKADERGIWALRSVLADANYLFFTKTIRGVQSLSDPWFSFKPVESIIKAQDSPYINTILLLYLGGCFPRKDIENEIGRQRLDAILDTGLWESRDGNICYRNLVIHTYQGLFLVTEQNPWFENCLNKNTDVYIGSDSLRLAENISFRRGAHVLDLCSGTGIQGLMAAKSAERVVSVELNEKAVPVTKFNILLNGVQDRMEVRHGSLYEVLGWDELFDCIYANPPFIPMLDDVVYPMCGGGGEDGLRVLRSIMEGLPGHLKKDGEVVIFCECLGDEKGVFFDRDVEDLCRKHNYRCTAAQLDRVEGGMQIERLSGLTALFQDDFDRADFKKKMHAIYDRLGAKYLYSILYRIESTGDPSFDLIKCYNPWHYTDLADVNKGFNTKKRLGYEVLCIGDKEIKMVSEDVAMIVKLFSQGYSLEKIAKWLYVTYKGITIGAKTGYYEYLNMVMIQSRQLENDGILERRKADRDL